MIMGGRGRGVVGDDVETIVVAVVVVEDCNGGGDDDDDKVYDEGDTDAAAVGILNRYSYQLSK
jgi:hypothetical protein